MSTTQEKEDQQLKLSALATWKDDFTLPLQYVGAVDVSFEEDSAIGGIVIWRLKEDQTLDAPVYKDSVVFEDLPEYQSGFLAFREYPIFETLLNKVPKELYPQLLLVDGNGIYHIRKCGSATHLGVGLDIPTIGVSKKFYVIDGWTTADDEKLENIPYGEHAEIRGKSDGFLYAYKMPCSKNSKHCVYVSPGHRVSHDTAKKLILTWSTSKIPEPIRVVDLYTRGKLAIEIDTKNKADKKKNKADKRNKADKKKNSAQPDNCVGDEKKTLA